MTELFYFVGTFECIHANFVDLYLMGRYTESFSIWTASSSTPGEYHSSLCINYTEVSLAGQWCIIR